MLSETFNFGTLDGRLKQAQTRRIIEMLERAHPRAVFNTDTIPNTVPESVRRNELYTAHSGAEIELLQEKLLAGSFDLMVCSACDLVRPLPEGLAFAAVPNRLRPFDALLNVTGDICDDLPNGTSIGVLSRRSLVQVNSLWEKLEPVLLAGGAVASLRRLMGSKGVENLVLPASVAELMGVQDRVSEIFFPETMLPGPGQGLLAVIAREDDRKALDAMAAIDSEASRHEMLGELALRERICSDQDCPVGALAQVSGDSIVITGAIGSLHGGSLHRAVLEGQVESAADLGARLAEQLMSRATSLLDLLEADFPEGLPDDTTGDDDDLFGDDDPEDENAG